MPTLSSHIVKREIASVRDVEEALGRQSLYGGDLVTNLLELARVSEERLTAAVAESFGLQAAQTGTLPHSDDAVRRMVPAEIAHRYTLYPLAETEGRLLVAVSEPLPSEVVSDLEFSLGLTLDQRIAPYVRVQEAVCRDYGLAPDPRVERVLARLNGATDPYPSAPPGPVAAPSDSAEPHAASEATPPALSEPPLERRDELPRGDTLPTSDSGASQAPAGTRAPYPPVDLGALARADARARRRRRRLGPYTAAMAEADLLRSSTRDEVMSAFFDFASQYFDYSVLLAVHGDLAEGRDAHGAGATRAKVLGMGVPLDLPSTLATVTAREPYRLARLSATGLDAALAKDLERRPGPAVLLLPIRVRQRAVLVLYGDHGDTDVQLTSIGDVISFAPLVSAALERVILRRKGVPQPLRFPGARPGGSEKPERRAPLPNIRDRAAALASALVDAPLPQARISSPPDTQTEAALSESTSTSAVERTPGAFARPVISVGPELGTEESAPAIPPLRKLPNELLASASTSEGPLTPIWGSPYSIPPTSRTPVPSSFAPGAPPHVPVQHSAGHASLPVANGSALTEPALGGPEPEHAVAPFRRTPTPVGMPAPPHMGAWTPVMPLVAPHPDPQSELSPSEVDANAEPTIEQVSVAEATVEPLLDDVSGEHELTPVVPLSRSLAHSARPLPPPRYSEELRLPTVIVDLAHDTEELVQRTLRGETVAAERLVEIGAAAVPSLVGAFPGPITSELRRGAGEGPARASDCGPILKILARIGPRAAGVLGVRTNDSDPQVRAWATRLLGEMPCPDAGRAVARRFVDEDAEVRRAALAAGRLLQAHPTAAEVLSGTLSEMLLDSSRKDALTHMVIEAIADLREARTMPALASLLATGSAEIQRSAHWALVVLARTDCGDDAVAWDHWWRTHSSRHRIEWLIDALMHESQEIRRAAGDELKSITKEYFGYYDDLPARERERAQQRYREWWESKGKARFGAAHP